MIQLFKPVDRCTFIVTVDLQVDINKLEIYWPRTVYFYPTHFFSTSELKTLIVMHIFRNAKQ